MIRKLLFVFLFVSVFISPHSFAQPICDGGLYSTELQMFVTLLANDENPIDTLNMINDWVDSAIVNCSDPVSDESPDEVPGEPVLVYSSAENGMQPVIGPLTVPDGIYKITVKTDGFFAASIEALEGECETGVMGLFNLTMEIATDGASAPFAAIDCQMLLEISNTTKEWTLEFYEIDLEAPVLVAPSYSSDDVGLYSVSDMLVFEDGIYRVRVETDGFFAANIETIVGDCDAGFIGLFNLSQGQANGGAEATLRTSSCIGILTTSNVTKPWIMTFEKIG